MVPEWSEYSYTDSAADVPDKITEGIQWADPIQSFWQQCDCGLLHRLESLFLEHWLFEFPDFIWWRAILVGNEVQDDDVPERQHQPTTPWELNSFIMKFSTFSVTKQNSTIAFFSQTDAWF